MKTQVSGMKRQLQEAAESHSKSESKLTASLNNLRQLQEEKGSLEAKLGQKQAALIAQVSSLVYPLITCHV